MISILKKLSMNTKDLFKEPWIKRVVRSNKKLYKFLFNLKNNNIFVFALRNFWKDTDSLFKTIVIETNPICNRSCAFCPMSLDKTPKKMMSQELFNKILKELRDLNFNGKILMSNFGEPLLDERLADFAKRIKSTLGSKIQIYTNGDFLTKERLDEIFLAGIDSITISQHDRELSPTLQKLFSQVTLEEKKHLNFEVINEDTEVLVNWGGSVKINSPEPMYCLVCDPQKIIVRADGKVSFCCRDYYNEVRLGDINKSSLIDIWNGKAFRKIRSEIKRGVFILPICKRCMGKI